MRIWAVANQKGGVGKTTTAVTLAGLLSQQGHRVLLVDMDPHGSMTSYMGYDPEGDGSSLYSLFHGGSGPVDEMIRKTQCKMISIFTASTALATLDRQLGTQDGKGLVIARGLAQVNDDYDYALLDCPPTLGVLMVNALAACHYLIVPVQSEFLALKGLERMMRTISMMNHARMQPIPYLIVPTLFDRRTRASGQALDNMKERYPETLWNGIIPVDTQFREASRAGRPVSLLSPRSRGSLAYDELLQDLLVFDLPGSRAKTG
ncbi:MAG: ParA family protein [Gammaproteobacteria bacterium]|nr:ParA family protein [Gammaproteobacteria bacterium]